MKRRRFSIKKFALFVIVLIILVFIALLGLYKINIGSVSNNTKAVSLEVKEGNNYYSIAHTLKEKNLIKSEFFYKVFLKIHKPESIAAGKYELNEAMNVSEIVESLSSTKSIKYNVLKITIKEGKNIPSIADLIEEKTEIKSEDFIKKINDSSYIDTLKEKYWFITDEVKNQNIYYKLEGYLYPDTYVIKKDDVSVENIVETFLDNTEKKLEDLKSKIKESEYTTHELLTLASIIELESVTKEDRENVSGVFYNRLNNGWTLGSDVTTYYASKKSMKESLTVDDLNACNGYNTRCSSMVGLPVGPIDNPSITSIEAAVSPAQNDYYYFVADSEKKVYFTKNATEHQNIIAKLKKEGKWLA